MKTSITFLVVGIILSFIQAKGIVNMESENSMLFIVIGCTIAASIGLWDILFGKLKITFENLVVFGAIFFFFYKCSYNGKDSFEFIQKLIS